MFNHIHVYASLVPQLKKNVLLTAKYNNYITLVIGEGRIVAVKLKIPCYIEYNDEKLLNKDGSHTVGSYKVFIHTSWMKHKGIFIFCYIF